MAWIDKCLGLLINAGKIGIVYMMVKMDMANTMLFDVFPHLYIIWGFSADGNKGNVDLVFMDCTNNCQKILSLLDGPNIKKIIGRQVVFFPDDRAIFIRFFVVKPGLHPW